MENDERTEVIGTNYYLIRDEKSPCPHCCRPYPVERLRIWKSSCGWAFALHYDEENGLLSLEDWVAKWSQPDRRIEDEYNDPVTNERMLEVITKRDHPRGLLRHDVDRYCAGHGPGTWDLVRGEFS